MGLNPRLIFVDSCCNSYNLIHSLVYMLERAVEAVDVGQLVDHTEEAGQSNDQPSMPDEGHIALQPVVLDHVAGKHGLVKLDAVNFALLF